MATQQQSDYIQDLVIQKTKEFKEVKELMVSQNIIAEESQTVLQSGTLAEICNAITDKQASQLIDILIAKEEPSRGTRYADKRMKQAIDLMDDIKSDINSWDFNGLR